MKVKRYKKAQRYISFYRNHFGFRAPYQILLDGTFCQAALKNKVNLAEQIPKYLSDEVKLLTTVCVVTETEKLGMYLKVFWSTGCSNSFTTIPPQTQAPHSTAPPSL